MTDLHEPTRDDAAGTIPTTMRAWRIHEFGGPDALRSETIAVPQPGDGALLVRIAATSVNPVDIKLREGKAPFLARSDLPATLGRDVAGTVAALREGAEGVSVGDAVYGMPAFPRGSYADYAILEAGEWAPVPTRVGMAEAGVVPLAALTAWQGLFDQGGLGDGQRVLIHGGSGGVGHYAVQFAKARGAEVFATASAGHQAFLREIGADRAIDYENERFEDVVRDADVVLALVSGETQQRSWGVLKPGGILVSTLDEPGRERPEAAGKRGTRFPAQPAGAPLRQIAALIDSDKVRPHSGLRQALDDIAEAQRAAEKGDFCGKLAIDV